MISSDNKYTTMQKNFYDSNATKMAVRDHGEHNDNPDYWNILVTDQPDVLLNKEISNALDFGCGTGRNVNNLLSKWNWNRVDGVDISKNNIEEAKKKLAKFDQKKFTLFVNNGVDLSELKDNEYDFVMSTIVFQHISVYDIRYSLLKELYRVMKPNGLLSIQMGYGANKKYKTVGYYENFYDATGTNSDCNVRVDDPNEIILDLKKIGFKLSSYIIKPSYSDDVHSEWIYVKAVK